MLKTSLKRNAPITITPKNVKSPLKWAGGKRWLVDAIKPYWEKNSHRRLVEPFAGGLSMSLGLLPKQALLNDVNEHLVNFYEQIKKGLVVTLPMVCEEHVYYAYRNRFNELKRKNQNNTSEAAQIFYYLNKTGFNGLCRFNRKGEHNVPFGKYKNVNYLNDFEVYKKIFSKWDFKLGDFTKLKLKKTDFIYADPPYDVEFTEYSSGGFSWDDQIRTANWLAKHPGPVIVSNQATPRILNLYKKLGFKIMIIDAPRMISCSGNRDKVKEVLAFKNL
jgi:DNA adenine methylase